MKRLLAHITLTPDEIGCLATMAVLFYLACLAMGVAGTELPV
jgi:hypothetical protein